MFCSLGGMNLQRSSRSFHVETLFGYGGGDLSQYNSTKLRHDAPNCCSGIQLAHNNALEELLAWDRCGNCNAGSSEQTNHSIPRTTWEDLVDPSKLLLAFSDPGSTDSIRSRSATDQTNTITATLRDGDGHTAAEAAFTSLAKDLDKQCNITTADTLQTFAPEDHLDQRTDAGNTVSEELATNMPTEDEFWTWDEQRQRFVHKEKNGREIVCPTWFD